MNNLIRIVLRRKNIMEGNSTSQENKEEKGVEGVEGGEGVLGGLEVDVSGNGFMKGVGGVMGVMSGEEGRIVMEGCYREEGVIYNDLDDKIYCANCTQCILMKIPLGNEGEYVLRVKCASKKWKKKLGEEKIYKFFTVARRTVDSCDFYEPMGDLKGYLRDLRKSLPIKDEVYKS